MLLLKFLLIVAGVGMFGGVAGVVAYYIYVAAQLRRLLARGAGPFEPAPGPGRP